MVFITDGGLQLGMGHVQQSITLARELQPHASVSFLTKSLDPVLDLIRGAGFDATRLEDDAAILRHLEAARPDVTVFDKLDVDEDLARDIRRRLPGGLAIFTNLTAANRHAHLAVVADIGSRFRNVRSVDPETGTVWYHGPKYWIMRREFRGEPRGPKDRSPRVERALLIFGGSDPANLTSAVLDELLRSAAVPAVEVILGAHFGHDANLAAVLARHPAEARAVTLHRSVGNVAELMRRADLVLASPGLSAFEALCVGTPVLILPQNPLQGDTYRGFMKMLERDEVARLPGMIAAGDFTLPEEAHIVAMEIGRGVDELVGLLLRLGDGGRP